MREFRWWLCQVLLLTTALCGGPHHHAREDLTSMLRPERGCGDDCTHFAGHKAPDLAQFDRDCSACHYQRQSSDLARPGVLFFQHPLQGRCGTSSQVAPFRPVLHSSSRAPPRVLA